MDESHFEHTGEVLGGFLEPREDASAFFQPADQPLNDVSLAVEMLLGRTRQVGRRGPNSPWTESPA